MGLTFFDDDRLARELYAVASLSTSPAQAGEGISRLLAPIVAHDAISLVGTDPASNPRRGCFGFWHEYTPALVSDLVTRCCVAGTPGGPSLAAVDDGQPGQLEDRRLADRLTERVLAAHGVGSHLRLVLAEPRGAWGVLQLLRSEGARPFGEDDARRAARLRPALVSALRRYVTSGPLGLGSDVPALPAGVVVLDADHRITSATPQARAWYDQLTAGGGEALPAWTIEVLFAGLSVAARAAARDGTAPTSVLCTPSAVFGRWVTHQAQPLDADGTGQVAVVVQGAAGDLVLPSFCAWYGLTPRERDIVVELREGSAAKQIARRLGLSPYTVNDHLKAVFRKTGADGRDELVAALTR